MAFLVGFLLFFLAIALTLIMGGISRLDDKRIEQTGHPSKRASLFTRRNLPAA